MKTMSLSMILGTILLLSGAQAQAAGGYYCEGTCYNSDGSSSHGQTTKKWTQMGAWWSLRWQCAGQLLEVKCHYSADGQEGS